MTQSLRLSHATLPNGMTCDVVITEGKISHISHPGTAPIAEENIDLSHHILSVGLVEPHAHLDKAFLADRIKNPTGDLTGAINGLEEVRHTLTYEDILHRSIQALKLLSRNGVTSVRTHADTTREGQLTSVLALLEAKRQCAHFINVQVAMLLQWPITGIEGADIRAIAKDAVQAGVDVVGACPHLDTDPQGAIEWILGLACEYGLPLDIHADENLRTESSDLEFLADSLLSQKISIQANASHCVSLSTRSLADIERISEKVASAGVSVTVLPQTNLYLQGRDHTSNVPRAIAPIGTLRKHGVNVAAGADNLQDPFNVVGRGDPMETASLLVMASHETAQDAYNLVSENASQVVHREKTSIAIGQPANLVAIPATTVRESIAMGPPDRIVVYGGVVMTEEKRNRK